MLEDDLPAGEFDLVHLRLLLAWLSEPQTALRRLAAALKPGGWLLAEEMDFGSVAADPHMDAGARSLFTRVAAFGGVRVRLADRHGRPRPPSLGRRA